MVRQHHRRYVWLEASHALDHPLPLWERSRAREGQNQSKPQEREGKRLFRHKRRNSWEWQYTVWVAVVAGALALATGNGTAQERGSVVDYRIVLGAIPEPLTDQSGDADRGRRIALDREGGDCTICHAMPLPQRQFHGTIGPPLDGVGDRYTAGEVRLRLVDPKVFNPDTIMPAYHRVEGLHHVRERYRGQPILTAQQFEDVVAYLLTLRNR
jgi:sulfur-oxidizing protein SoxX